MKKAPYHVTRNLRIVQAFTTLAIQRDVRVTEDVGDQSVHSRLFELASVARFAAELSGSLDIFLQEVTDVCVHVSRPY